MFKIEGNIEFFLDVTDNFTFGCGDERVTSFSENLHEVVSQVTTSKIESHDSMWKSITFIDWDIV